MRGPPPPIDARIRSAATSATARATTPETGGPGAHLPPTGAPQEHEEDEPHRHDVGRDEQVDAATTLRVAAWPTPCVPPRV